MIALWMFTAVLFSILIAAGALATEHALRALRRPTRLPWLFAIVAAVLWPLAAPIASRLMPPEPEPIGAISVQPAWVVGGDLANSAASWAERADGVALMLWALASGTLLVQLFRAIRVLRRARVEAKAHIVDGEPVLVTESLGPAVVGLRDPRIIVPAWLLHLDAPLRELVLRHEREHCRAGDARLVWLGVFATALVPWNPAIWFMTRRLRLAMEIDCDARTLRGVDDHQQYGKLLLLIAGRQSSARLMPMLAESSSNLARRISAMRQTNVRYRGVRVAILGAVAAGAVVAACSPRVVGNLGGTTGPVPASAAAEATPAKPKPTFVSPNDVLTEAQVERPAVIAPGTRVPAYPKALRDAGVQGTVIARFVVRADGSVDTASIQTLQSDHKDFETSVREALAGMRFLAATVGGKTVPQFVQQPFQFALNGAKETPRVQNALTTTALAKPVFVVAAGEPKMLPGFVGPTYPQALRDAGVEGAVLVAFVVDRDGSIDVSTIKVLKSDHPAFEAAVLEALPRARFTPPMIDGKAVRQLLQRPFQFSLNR
ncbi:MAG TPA: M56 family metallopeptidase [Gemmatimonas sp.]|nr:M56 family metallopeptidase [Gemmatimonas sp.]